MSAMPNVLQISPQRLITEDGREEIIITTAHSFWTLQPRNHGLSWIIFKFNVGTMMVGLLLSCVFSWNTNQRLALF